MAKKTATEAPSIKEAYKLYLLENGKKPVSVYKFSKENGMTEAEFFNEYNSFELIDREIWKDLLDETITRIKSDEVYNQYSVREKLLSFYYTLIEVLKQNRSYVLLTWQNGMDLRKTCLREFLKSFEEYAQEIVQEGVATKEIVNRVFLTERYADGMKAQLIFIIEFWIRDSSKGFEQTDAAIEKAVNTGFDLIGKSPLDSFADFGKFLFQHFRNN
jgi:hypothetical protein